MKENIYRIAMSLLGLSIMTVSTVQADEKSDLANKLNNPVAAMISLPLQFNYDENYGPDDDGNSLTLKVQPVIPFEWNDEWNVISRTIIPITTQDDIYPGAGTQTGIGNISQSFFFSPKAKTENGWIWGVGPAFVLNTATDNLLGGDQWLLGPTAVFLKQENGWTTGALISHTWSFADDMDRTQSSTFFQPILAYVTPDAWTYSLSTEATYDWKGKQASIPINATVAKLVTFGEQHVSITVGARYWADSFEGAAEGWGGRFQLTFLIPE